MVVRSGLDSPSSPQFRGGDYWRKALVCIARIAWGSWLELGESEDEPLGKVVTGALGVGASELVVCR